MVSPGVPLAASAVRVCSSTCPPWAATTAETMLRPKPVEPPARLREVSPRAKRSKTCGRSSLGTPGPLSLTVSLTQPASRASPVVDDDLVQPAAVADDLDGLVG